MAWRCSGSSNIELLKNLKKNNIITNPRVFEAMSKVDRANYVNQSYPPYEDSPQSIGFNATISAPHMHAYALEALEHFAFPGAKVLDVGCGSGYICACLSYMVGTEGKVVGIDHIKGLTDMAKMNLERDQLEYNNTEIILGDGRKGYLPEAPYDCIHVGAATDSYPKELLDQLKSPGRMFVPVGTHSQSIILFEKDKLGAITKKNLMGVCYIPLTDADKQWKN